ncbi:unnamed protein product [Calypogeia fissa]
MVQLLNSRHTWSTVSVAEGGARNSSSSSSGAHPPLVGVEIVTAADAIDEQDRYCYTPKRFGIETSRMLSPETLVVGLSLQQEPTELLSWAFNTAAHAGDHFVVLHIIEHASIAGKGLDEDGMAKHMEDVKAHILTLLDPFRELVAEKDLSTQLRVVFSDTLEQTLVDEASALGATLLILSTSRRHVAPWRIQGSAGYCSRHAAPGCSVVVVTNKKILLYKEHRPKCFYDGSSSPQSEDTQQLLAKSRYKGFPAPFNSALSKPPASSKEEVVPVKYSPPFEASRSSTDKAAASRRDSNDRATTQSHSQMSGGCLDQGGEALSPRGVLDGLESFADSCNSSPSGSYNNQGGWSPQNCRKSLLSPISSSSDEGGRHSDRQQKPCLTLWKSMSMRRWNTFPASNQKAPKRSPSNFLAQSVLRLCQGPHPLTPSPSLDRDQASAVLCSALTGKPHWRFFSAEELSAATHNFNPDNIVGKGGYAHVYKGVLADGSLIAVKKLTKGETEEEKEHFFLTELGIVSHVSHPNANELIGFCIEGGLHLVFRFSHNGSLATFLYGVKPQVLEWGVRFRTAVGVARGLHYLHRECPRRIIHRDIKASNILLGEDFEPQISDFGLAKWLPEHWTHHTVTPVEGTFGYLAPEYFMHGIVDEKTDVFAYGVLLLELITGRRAIDSAQQSLVMWARPHLESENIQELVDPRLENVYDPDEMHRVVLAATLCIRQSAVWRPCMSQVISLLEDEDMDVDMSSALSSLGRKSTDSGTDSGSCEEPYSCDNYSSDMSRHRALALEF